MFNLPRTAYTNQNNAQAKLIQQMCHTRKHYIQVCLQALLITAECKYYCWIIVNRHFIE